MERLRHNLTDFTAAHRGQLHRLGVLCLLGVAYFLFVTLTGWSLPCPVQSCTGFACPGCGISHFCTQALHFHFLAAARENLAAALLLLPWGAVILLRICFAPPLLHQSSGFMKGFMWGSIGLLLLFGVLRNLPGFDFLLPSYYDRHAAFAQAWLWRGLRAAGFLLH